MEIRVVYWILTDQKYSTTTDIHEIDLLSRDRKLFCLEGSDQLTSHQRSFYNALRRACKSGRTLSNASASSCDNCSSFAGNFDDGAFNPTICESISTPSSAKTWFVMLSASSSTPSESNASINASSIISSLTAKRSFSFWNSFIILVVSLTFIALFAVAIAPVTDPMADAAVTCVAIVVACIPTAPMCAFAVISFSRCFRTWTNCFANAANAGSFAFPPAVFARCFNSIVVCFS
mmetsp:Transcript_28342/g.68944  ORF Transcript_28342/g.68944 Transcript_28342/m.68944 type:complete len:234 (+) Transcript_28342:66-767(+)